LKHEYSANEERMISDLGLARNTEELLSMLEKISSYVEEQISHLVSNGQYNEAADRQEMAARAYHSAAEIVETEERFRDYRNFSKSLKMTADYWHEKSESKPEILDHMLKEAYQFRDAQDYEKAIERFSKLLEINSNDFESWLEKGNCLYSISRFSEAVACYDNCMESSENEIHLHALCNKGLALINLGMHDQALKDLHVALDMARSSGNMLIVEFALVGIGRSYIELEKYNDAENILLQALEQNKGSIEAMAALSSLYNRRFEYAKAAQYAEKVLKEEPQRTEVKAGLSEFLLASEEYQRRESLVDEVLETSPDEFGYPMRLIKVCSLYFRKSMDEANKAALDLVEYCHSLHDNYPRSWHYKGLRNMIKTREVSEQIRKVLLAFITIAETSDELVRRRELSQLPGMIRLTKGKLRTYLEGEGPIAFKKAVRKKIIITNTSKPLPDRPGWYFWEIFLSPIEALAKVESVRYTLHNALKDPVRTLTNRQEGFKLKGESWGEFRVKVQINLLEGAKRETVTKYHWLELGLTP